MRLNIIKILIFHLCNFTLAQILNQNEESDGISTKYINDTIHDALGKTEYLDNVIRIVSWNIYDDPANSVWNDNKDEVCEFLKKITPMVSHVYFDIDILIKGAKFTFVMQRVN